MKSLTADEADRVLLQNLRKNKKRTFNETGIHFDGDIWAFPNNRKIFIGVNDYDMSDNTCFLVKRAMFRHELTKKIKDNRTVAIVGGVALLFMLFMGVKTCQSCVKDRKVKNKNSIISLYKPNLQRFIKTKSLRTK